MAAMEGLHWERALWHCVGVGVAGRGAAGDLGDWFLGFGGEGAIASAQCPGLQLMVEKMLAAGAEVTFWCSDGVGFCSGDGAREMLGLGDD